MMASAANTAWMTIPACWSPAAVSEMNSPVWNVANSPSMAVTALVASRTDRSLREVLGAPLDLL